MFNRLKNSKTLYAALTAIVATIALYMDGKLSSGQAFQSALTAVLAVLLRDGIAKQDNS